MSVSTRTRFEVFKRDGFRCVYCGATALASPLHVDHVVATANGGTDDSANLVTSCSPCNLGKSDVPLEQVQLAPTRSAEEVRDHAAQTLGYLEAVRELACARDEAIAFFAAEWDRRVGYLPPNIEGRFVALAEAHGPEVVFEAMDIVGAKGLRGVEAVRYFHGILRRKREEAEKMAPTTAPESAPRREWGGNHVVPLLYDVCEAMVSWSSTTTVPTEIVLRWSAEIDRIVQHELARVQAGDVAERDRLRAWGWWLPLAERGRRGVPR